MPRELSLVAVFLAAVAVCYAATFAAVQLGRKTGVLDVPRAGEVQKRPVPRTGGYAILAGFLLASLLGAYLIPRSAEEAWRLLGALVGVVAVLPLAFLDDRRRLGPLPQLAGQTGIALIPVAFGIVITSIATPFWGTIPVPAWLVIPFTLVWVVGMINTINLVDVMDGLAAGIAAIAALVLVAREVLEFGQYDLAILPLALAGTCVGFLFHNFHPARIFMGSSGALLLGYALAVTSIMGGAKVATALLVLGVPIADVAWVIVRRIAAGRSPMVGGDERHLPQRLHKAGWSQRQIVLMFYALCLTFGLAAVWLAPALKVLAFAALAAVMAVLLVVLARRGEQGRGRGNKE